MAKLAKARASLVVITLLLLLNLSFSLFISNVAQLKSGKAETGLSGPVVSFGQTTEALLFTALKRTSNYQNLKFTKRGFRKDLLLQLILVALVFQTIPQRAFFKTYHSLKLEGG